MDREKVDIVSDAASELALEAKVRTYYDDMLMIDPLTAIPNRRGFYAITRIFIQERPDTDYVICCINFDKFKLVNDLFGIKAGDDLLTYMADHLRDYVQERGTYARLTADNFAMCIPDEEGICEKVTAELKKWFADYPLSINIVTRCGFYAIHDRSVEVGLMCDRANLAIQEIKGSYDRAYAVYDEKIRKRILQEQEILNEMNSALEEGQFVVYYQPKFNMESGKLIGSEALVRWMHPTKGMISPGVFVPIFEKNGFISSLDKYVWEQVCRDIREWIDEGLTVCPVSINVSRAELYNKTLSGYLVDMVGRYGIPQELVQLEITESAYTDDPDQIIRMVQELKSKGFVILMDDFGSGYSSLNTLKDVPVDVLKLDLKFLYNMDHNLKANYILKSVVQMAMRLDLIVIAEGVETETQAEFLKSIGCVRAQGYLYARPMPKKDLEFFLSDPDRVSMTDEDTRTGIVNIDDVLSGFHREDELEWYRAAIIQLNARLYEYDFENDILLLFDMQMDKESRELSRLEIVSYTKALETEAFMYADDARQVLDMIHRRESATLDIRIKGLMSGNSGYRWFRQSGRVLTTSDGTPKSIVGVLRDISDEKSEEAMLEVLSAFESETNDRVRLERVLAAIAYGMVAHASGMLITRSRKSTDLGGVALTREGERSVYYDADFLRGLDEDMKRLDYNNYGISILSDQEYESYGEYIQELFFSKGEKAVALYRSDILDSMTIVFFTVYRSTGKTIDPAGMRHLGEIFKTVRNRTESMYAGRYEKENVAMYTHAFNNTGARLWEWDINTHLLHRSPSAIDDDGMGEWVENMPEVFIEKGFIHPDFIEGYRKTFRYLSEGRNATMMIKKRQRDGSFIWRHIGFTVITDEEGDPVKAIGIGEDVNSLYLNLMKTREKILRKSRMVDDKSGWFRVDLDEDKVVEASGNLLMVDTKKSYEHYVHKMCKERVVPEHRQRFLAHNLIEKLIEFHNTGDNVVSTVYRYKDEYDNIARRALNVDISRGENGHLYALIRHRRLDAVEQTEKYVTDSVQWDSRFGAYGVDSFNDMVRHIVEKEPERKGALYIIDMDRSSFITDSLGEKYSEEVLLNEVMIIKALLQVDVIFGRLLYDRFAVYVPDCTGRHECYRIYRDIQKSIFNAFSIGKINYLLSCSIGLAFSEDSGGDYDELMARALNEMYDAK